MTLFFTFPLFLISLWPIPDFPNAEMPTSWDLKSGDSLFFTTPTLQISTDPPRNKLTQPPMGMAQDFIWSLTWTAYYQNSRSSFWCRNNLCQWLNTCKNAPETVLRIRKIHVLRKQWATSQTKAQKRTRDDFIRGIWWPVRESGRAGEREIGAISGRLSNNPGELALLQKSSSGLKKPKWQRWVSLKIA